MKASLKSIGPYWTSLADSFCVSPQTIEVFERRLRCEGDKFLLEYLPSLGKEFEKTLVTGKKLDIFYLRFSTLHGTELPLFLSELFLKVLNKDGSLRTDASPLHIKRIRQLLLLCYKLEVPYEEDDPRVSAAINSFTERDRTLTVESIPLDQARYGLIAQKARGLISRLLQKCNPMDIKPRHGSGATSCRTPNRDKYHSFRFIEKLNRVFPYDEYFFYNSTHLCDNLDDYRTCSTVETPVARLVCVPKDIRGPRLICCEPREHQFIQQGLMLKLYNHVERHWLTKGFVNFTNQAINQNLARQSSIDEDLATIDLKDASDRVRHDLVEYLFPGNWVDAFNACRTEHVQLPDGSTYGPMRKFAPMGSAVCFPVEALTFWALLKATLDCDVYVYGDDIIIPKSHVNEAFDILQAFSLAVNYDKSCYMTPFRESCGGDYYNGIDVGYVKFRQPVQDTIQSEVSLVEFTNQVSEHYGDMVAAPLRSLVDAQFGVHFTSLEQYELCYTGIPRASNDVFFRRRWHADHQRTQYLLPCVITRLDRSRTHPKFSWGEILRAELEGTSELRHSGCYATPGCTKKYRWRSV
jgi:hypothetical protein